METIEVKVMQYLILVAIKLRFVKIDNSMLGETITLMTNKTYLNIKIWQGKEKRGSRKTRM